MDTSISSRKTRPNDAGPAIHPEDAPPIVEDWRDLDDTLAPFLPTGATLSLVGIKHQRMVGRIAERDFAHALRGGLYRLSESHRR